MSEYTIITPHFFAELLRELAELSEKIDAWNADEYKDAIDDPRDEYESFFTNFNDIAREAERRQEQGRITLAEYAEILLIIDTLSNELQDVDDAATTL